MNDLHCPRSFVESIAPLNVSPFDSIDSMSSFTLSIHHNLGLPLLIFYSRTTTTTTTATTTTTTTATIETTTEPRTTPSLSHLFLLLLALLLNLLHEYASFLVLAPLVLEPDPDDPRTESSHLNQLFLHEGVRTGVGAIAGAQGVQLFLVQHSPHPRRLVMVGR